MVTTTHHLILAGGSVRHKSPSNPSQPTTSTYHGCHSSRTWERNLCRGFAVCLPWRIFSLGGTWSNCAPLRHTAPAPTEMLCLWRRSFGGATPVTASPIVSQLRHFFSEFPALTMTMTLFAAGDLVADLRWCSLVCDQLLCDSLHPAAKGWLQFLCELEEQRCRVGTCGVKHVLKKMCLRWLIGTTFMTELIHRVYDCHVLIMIRWNAETCHNRREKD